MIAASIVMHIFNGFYLYWYFYLFNGDATDLSWLHPGRIFTGIFIFLSASGYGYSPFVVIHYSDFVFRQVKYCVYFPVMVSVWL